MLLPVAGKRPGVKNNIGKDFRRIFEALQWIRRGRNVE